MCLNLNDYQFKTSRYSYRLIYTNLSVTTIQKPTIDAQKTKRKGSKHNSKENHQSIGKRLKEDEKNREEPKKTMRK